MATPTQIPEFAALKQALESHDAAGDTPEQAALVVSCFTDQRTVPTLDSILAAAQGSDQVGAAAEIHEVADQLAQQTEMLFREVTRFLALSPDGPTSEPNST